MSRTIRSDPRGRHRVFWLLVALSVALLVAVSTIGPAGAARQGAGVTDLLRGIERNLSALRVQLELIGADDPGFAHASVAADVGLNPELGDGGHLFRLRSMETMVRSLERRVDRLVEAQDRAGNGRGLDLARLMSLDARSVLWGVEELRFAREPDLVRAARARIAHALDEVARGARAVAALQTDAAAPRQATAG